MRGRLCVLVALAACRSSTASREPPAPAHQITFEADDVAILYPPGGGGITAAELVPRAIYERAFGSEGALQLGGTPAAPPLAMLHLVAIRIDPQREQLRLVFQPAGERDDAVHVFFALDHGEARGLAEAVAELRGPVKLGALAPHPLLVRDGVTGPFGHGLAALIRQHARAAKLARITVFTSSGLGTAWNFFGVDVAAGGATTPVAIPTLPPDTRLEAFFAGFVEGELTGDAPFTPSSTALAARDDLRILASRDRLARVAPAARDQALAAAARIEDPRVHTPETIDCASCHVAHLVQAHGALDLHMFGYSHGRPSIQPRTTREVADSVAALNGP